MGAAAGRDGQALSRIRVITHSARAARRPRPPAVTLEHPDPPGGPGDPPCARPGGRPRRVDRGPGRRIVEVLRGIPAPSPCPSSSCSTSASPSAPRSPSGSTARPRTACATRATASRFRRRGRRPHGAARPAPGPCGTAASGSTSDAERHSCRPSVDVLFESLAREHGAGVPGRPPDRHGARRRRRAPRKSAGPAGSRSPRTRARRSCTACRARRCASARPSACCRSPRSAPRSPASSTPEADVSEADAVLIVDDSLTVRMDLADAFEAAGFESLPCGTAPRPARRSPPGASDLVVLDVLLPDGDGVELLRELRGGPPRRDPGARAVDRGRGERPHPRPQDRRRRVRRQALRPRLRRRAGPGAHPLARRPGEARRGSSGARDRRQPHVSRGAARAPSTPPATRS